MYMSDENVVYFVDIVGTGVRDNYEWGGGGWVVNCGTQ